MRSTCPSQLHLLYLIKVRVVQRRELLYHASFNARLEAAIGIKNLSTDLCVATTALRKRSRNLILKRAERAANLDARDAKANNEI